MSSGANAKQLADDEQRLAELPALADRPLVVPRPAFNPIAILGDDRRVARRISLRTEITFHSESNFFTGFTNDISEGGVFLATVNVMPVGTEVELRFSLPGGRQVEARGEVRWVRELDERDSGTLPGMGIRFTMVPTWCVQAIRQFEQEREPLFFPET